jgi:hypothetical protein
VQAVVWQGGIKEDCLHSLEEERELLIGYGALKAALMGY